MTRPLQVDPRGLRFSAALTSVVLAAALLSPRPVALVLLAAQALVFATGASGRFDLAPYGRVFARLVRPRVGAPSELEDARAPQFAQGVGLTFTLVAVVALAAGLDVVGLVATGLALVAALLNAVVGFCLGCETYLVLRRVAPARA